MDRGFTNETVVRIGNDYAVNKRFYLYGIAHADISSKVYGLEITPTGVENEYHICGTLTRSGYTRFWTYLRLGYAEYKHTQSRKQQVFSIKAELRKIEERRQELTNYIMKIGCLDEQQSEILADHVLPHIRQT
jgi:hypothetical protein